ncbi:MAG TPA: alkaline phosphatase D family protein [Steroidobacteraceae bacterium]|nr:alkaline phosphatase D family protein [Steroidobacteraceae bacterium]
MSRPVTRRDFVRFAGGAGALALLPLRRAAAQVRFPNSPFQLGVASGDPSADGFVIWTRLAPEPLDTGFLGQAIFEVDWDVAEDAAFTRLAKQGTAWARPHLAHSVHVEVGGLAPGREYFYRFRIGRYESPVGRALTCPPADSSPAGLRFAFASCAHYEQGFFSAYRHLAADRPDLVFMLGDYIYEDSWGDRRVRSFDSPEAVTLAQYRNRYTQNKTDPDLQAAHAVCPWLVSWDDHEVDNDYVGLTSEHELCGGAPVREAFPARRAAAYQAWYEHMPVRPSRLQAGMAIRIYGATDWGRLARFYLLDTRQYRSVQACPAVPTAERCDFANHRKILFGGAGGSNFADPDAPDCKAALADESRTVLGAEQERWLEGALAGPPAGWNVIAQNVMVATIMEGTRESPKIYTDAWAGYPPARERLFAALRRHRPSNAVVLTGDIHSFWVAELENAAGDPVGVELVTSSVCTSTYDKTATLPLNPWVRYHDGRHNGYVRCELTREKLRADFVGIEDRTNPASGAGVIASFEVAAGEPHAKRI